MRISYANNFSEALTAAKDNVTDYLTVASGGGDFASLFGASNADDYAVPITIVSADGATIKAIGYAVSWDFGAEDGKVYVSPEITGVALVSGDLVKCRLRAGELNAGPSRHRDIRAIDNDSYTLLAPFTHIAVGSGGAEIRPPDTNGAAEVTTSVTYAVADTTPRHLTVVLVDTGATQPTLTWGVNNYDDLHWTSAGAPAFSSGYARLVVQFWMADQYHWLGTWAAHAD